MKRHLKIERLFRAARRAGLESRLQPVSMPTHLQTRILAHRRSATEEDWFLPLALRRALICAGLIMVICLAWGATDLWTDNDNEVVIANLELQQDLMQ